jgi:hypothetical protein
VQDAITAVANGRIFGGVHYRFSTVAGTNIAHAVVDNLTSNYFQPVADQPTAPMPPQTGTGTAGSSASVAPWAAVLAGTIMVMAASWLLAHRGRRAA